MADEPISSGFYWLKLYGNDWTIGARGIVPDKLPGCPWELMGIATPVKWEDLNCTSYHFIGLDPKDVPAKYKQACEAHSNRIKKMIAKERETRCVLEAALVVLEGLTSFDERYAVMEAIRLQLDIIAPHLSGK